MKPGKEIVEDKGEENIHSQGYTEVREGKERIVQLTGPSNLGKRTAEERWKLTPPQWNEE